jgi:hypothetical protein
MIGKLLKTFLNTTEIIYHERDNLIEIFLQENEGLKEIFFKRDKDIIKQYYSNMHKKDINIKFTKHRNIDKFELLLERVENY